MTRPSTTGHTDPTVQPVPASVVEQVDAADTTRQNPKRAVVSLGANLGNRLETLQGAVDALERLLGPSHPRCAAFRARIDFLDRTLRN